GAAAHRAMPARLDQKRGLESLWNMQADRPIFRVGGQANPIPLGFADVDGDRTVLRAHFQIAVAAVDADRAVDGFDVPFPGEILQRDRPVRSPGGELSIDAISRDGAIGGVQIDAGAARCADEEVDAPAVAMART